MGTDALVKDLRRLVQANMEAEAERFAAALNANAIAGRLLAVAVDDRRRPPAPSAACCDGSGSAGRSAFASATIASASSRAACSAPVAAIASHTLSACSGVRTARRSSRASSGSRSRARISGSVTVRRAGRCRGACRSAPPGPGRRARHRAAGTRARSARRTRPAADVPTARQRAQLARGPEQPRGLEIAAPQVALARRLQPPGVLALQQLALAPAPTRRRQHAHRLDPPAARQFGERAREQQVAGRGSDRAARAGDHGRRPRRSTAASSTSSWTSVAEWTSSTATAARSAASWPAALGPRRRTPAAAAAACRRRRSSRRRARRASSPCDAAIASSRSSSARINPGTWAPPASTTAATASALAISDGPVVQRDDPARGQIHRRRGTRPRPARRQRRRTGETLHRGRQVRVGLVEATEERHHAIEPQREERRQGRLLRRRDLQDHHAPAGLHHPHHLAQALRRSPKLRAPKPTVAASNVSSGYGSAIASACSHVSPGRLRPRPRRASLPRSR